MNTIWFAFLTGLTTGGLSCVAVQGGLLASSLGERKSAGRFGHIGFFLLAKFIVYVLLGFLLGALGSMLTLSPKVLGFMQIVVGFFLLATAGRILDIHPMFRYFVIQPPRFVYRLLKKKSNDGSAFAPLFLGALTVLMPCGVTQATMAVAIASGSPAMGAAIMGAFILGTSPVFFILGASIVELLQRKAFAYIAAGVIVMFAILSINGGLGLFGSIYTIQNLYTAAITPIGGSSTQTAVVADMVDGKQNVTISVTSGGYASNVTTLKKDVPVHLTLSGVNARGCVRAFTVPDLNISQIVPENGTQTIEFTPKQTGRLAYTCSMGMFQGAFNVIN